MFMFEYHHVTILCKIFYARKVSLIFFYPNCIYLPELLQVPSSCDGWPSCLPGAEQPVLVKQAKTHCYLKVNSGGFRVPGGGTNPQRIDVDVNISKANKM